jgi:hypothetical protein
VKARVPPRIVSPWPHFVNKHVGALAAGHRILSGLYPNQDVDFVAASFSWAPVTCRSEPIHFALSSVRFVSGGATGKLRIAEFTS